MKPIHSLSAAATLVVLASCSAPKGGSIQQYAVMSHAGPSASTSSNIQLSLKEPMRKQVDYPAHAMKAGKEFHISARREFIYPASYEPATASADLKLVAPATPTSFTTLNTGMDAKLTATRQGSLTLIKGSISITEFDGFSKMGGALGQPILDSKERVITENRVELPKFVTYTTPVFVAIAPDQPCTFEISAPRKGTKATLSIANPQ